MDNKKVATGIRIFGVIFFVVALGVLIWSLFRPPVTKGPELPDPPALLRQDAGVG